MHLVVPSGDFDAGYMAAISDDEAILATIGLGAVTFWQVSRVAQISQYVSPRTGFPRVEMAPGHRAFVPGLAHNEIVELDTDTATVINHFVAEGDSIEDFSFKSTVGLMAVTLKERHSNFELWPLTTNAERQSLAVGCGSQQDWFPESIDMSTIGKKLAILCAKTEITQHPVVIASKYRLELFDLSNSQLLWEKDLTPGRRYDEVRFSLPASDYVVVGDRGLNSYDRLPPEFPESLKDKRFPVTRMSNGSRVLASRFSDILVVADGSDARAQDQPVVDGRPNISPIAYGTKTGLLLARDLTSLLGYQMPSGVESKRFEVATFPVRALALSGDGGLFGAAIGPAAGIWELRPGHYRGFIAETGTFYSHISLDDKSSEVISAGQDVTNEYSGPS